MRTKHGASRLARQLEKDGFTAESIHGDKSQQARMEALQAFSREAAGAGRTDIAAPSLDIDSLPHGIGVRIAACPRRLYSPHRPHRARQSVSNAISFIAPKKKISCRHRETTEKVVPSLLLRASTSPPAVALVRDTSRAGAGCCLTYGTPTRITFAA
jgi:hypothetical protein